MCFSATGSFAISGILTMASGAALARNSSKPHRIFAGIPLIFAVQQAAEGTVWLTMDGMHPTLNRLTTRLARPIGVMLVVSLVVSVIGRA